MKRLVLLDRDGTLIVEKDHLVDPDDVELIPGAGDSVRRLRSLGLPVALVTNQSVIGRGLADAARVDEIHARVRQLLAEQGADLDGIWICPHLPGSNCDCRKPEPGMLVSAAQALQGDLKRSFVVGDKASDILAGQRVGATTILVQTGHSERCDQADFEVRDLPEAVTVIETLLRKEHSMGPDEALQRARSHLLTSAAVKTATAESCSTPIVEASLGVAACLRAGKKVMFAGNGGSAADSQHLAAELTNRLDAAFERPPIAAMALSVDSSFITSHANDYGYSTVFARQIEALGHKGDALVVISTSGNSENLIRAVHVAKAKGIVTVGFLGGSGGKLKALVDHPVVVPSHKTQHIQEGHIALGHVLCEIIEHDLHDPVRT